MRHSSINIERVSKLARISGLSALSHRLVNIRNKAYVRVLNYHHVAPDELDLFEQQIDYMARHFTFANLEHLKAILSGKTQNAKPSILLTFDDGLESHATYVADLLKRKNIQGVFFVPTAAPDLAVEHHKDWALEHRVVKADEDIEVNGRVFASWEAWMKISDYHIVASHTHDHVRFESSVSEACVTDQLTASYSSLTENLQIRSRIFCWVGGEKDSYSAQAVSAISKLDTELSFTTCSLPVTRKTNPLRIERTNVESFFSLDRVALCISGIVDLRYIKKRRQLDPVFQNNERR